MHHQAERHTCSTLTRARAIRRPVSFVTAFALLLAPPTPVAWAGPPFVEFVDPNPAPGNLFGQTVVALSTGNVVITARGDDAGGTDAGAVYLFNGATGALISTLTGSHANDQVGGVVALTNGNFVVVSSGWNGVGAVTWVSGTTGLSGTVSAANSLVGATSADGIGSQGVTALANGNYVVRSAAWDNGAAMDAGAVTWGDGTTGVTGSVSAANSLVGTTAFDSVGAFVIFSSPPRVSGLTALPNGSYVVNSAKWDNGSLVDAGAVTWADGATGVSGPVTSANSLVGTAANDQVGFDSVTVLSNGNYVVRSPSWDNGAATDAGAVTWAAAVAGVSGPVNSSNSLVGTTAGDSIGNVTALTNGNYVAFSQWWDGGPVADVGAVTWGSGTVGLSGAVSAANSLVGSIASDRVGSGGVTALTNGNYVVASTLWDSGVADVGAVTWGSGTGGISGTVSAANSLVGATSGDRIGSQGVTALTNGNYVARSSNWNSGAAVAVGAVTWGNGTTGSVGPVSVANSLVGSTAGDSVGQGGVTPLSNGNYVVSVGPQWDNGAVANVGAVTWGNGATGTSGVVSIANSLVGSLGECVGCKGVTALANGNYLVISHWSNGPSTNAGAVTWGDGAVGTSGTVSASNSLVGTSANDSVGYDGAAASVTALANGNYVVSSRTWTNGAATSAGAVTWGNGAAGTVGPVSAANSLVGSNAFDRVGSARVTALTNGNYLVGSASWDNVAVTDAGAVTWGNGATGTSGPVTALNSLVGGVATAGLQPVVTDDVNQTFFARFLNEGGGRVRLGSQVDGIGPIFGPTVTTPTSALITSTTATLGGEVTADGGSAITERGVVYSQTAANSDPLIGGTGVTKVPVIGTIGLFAGGITGLSPATGHSFKAFATNSAGTTYTSVSTFSTLATPCPTITLAGLPNGSVAVAYSGSATASGGSGPYAYAVSSGSLPGGLSLTASGAGAGDVVGTPATAGTFPFDVTATDTSGAGTCTGVQTYSVVINPNPAHDFFTLSPCRVLDTRNAAGPLGGPALAAQADRTFTVAGTCGIPADAKAISLNIAVTGPTNPGNIRLHPGATAVPLVSSVNFKAGQTRSNNAVIPLSALGQLAAYLDQAAGTAHLILDVNGYFK